MTHPAPPPPPDRPSRRQASSGAWDQLRTGPERVGSYLVERELGRGCYGVVYLVRREGLERRFALKVLTAEALRNPEAVARFEREAKLASRIQDPGIVAIHDLGREGRFPYYVMDVVRGPTLQERIRQSPLEPREAAQLVAELARTMEAAHQVGVLHRDLKPANVILDDVLQRPRVTDFGLAQEQGGMRLTRTGEAVGTPFYMAPEQNLGRRDLDARVDVYALGVILYESLTGAVPYAGSNFVEISQAIRRGQPRSIRSQVPQVPVGLEAICLKAMALDREARYPTSAALAAALDGFLGDARDAAAEPGGSGRAGPSVAVLAAGGVALFALAALGGGGVLILLQQQRERQGAALLARAQAAQSEAEARPALAELAALEPEGELAQGARREEERWARCADLAERLGRARGAELREVWAEIQRGGFAEAVVEVRAAAAAALVARAEAGEREVLEDARLLGSELSGLQARLARLELAQELALAQASGDAKRLRAALERAEPSAGGEELPGARAARTALAILDYEAAACAGRSASDLVALLDEAARRDEEGGDRLRVLRADAFRRRGRYQEAGREAERLQSSSDPEVATQARLTLAFVLLRLDRREEGLQAFETLARRYPSSPLAALAQAHFLIMGRGEAAKGLELLERYLRDQPRSMDGLVLRAVALDQLGRRGESQQFFAEARRQAPDHPRPYLMEAVSQAEAGRHEESLRTVAECLRRCEGGPFGAALLLRATLELQLQRAREADASATRLIELDERSVAGYVVRGAARLGLGQAGQGPAQADLRQALLIDRNGAYRAAQGLGPQFVQLLQQLEQGRGSAPQQVQLPTPRAKPAPGALGQAQARARAGASLEEVEQLLAGAEQAAQQAAEREAIELERLELLHRRGRYAEVMRRAQPFLSRTDRTALQARYLEAMSRLWLLRGDSIQSLSALWQAAPTSAEGLTAKAVALSHTGRNAEGMQAALEAIQRDPDHVDAYLSLAFCLHDQRRVAEAGAVLQQIAGLLGDHPRFYKAVAFVRSSLGDLKGAIEAYGRVIALTEPEPYLDALRKRAWLLYTQGQPREALADAERLLARLPQDLPYAWLRGLCKFSLGERAEAERIWQVCNQQNPQAVRQLLTQTPPEPRQAAQAALGIR